MKNLTLSIIAMSMICSLNSFAQLPAGVKAKYLFSNNYNDSSGNLLHGTGNNTFFVTDRFGKANSACFFNGSAEVNTPYMPANLTGYTFCVWVKNSLNQNTGGYAGFLSTYRHQISSNSPTFSLEYNEQDGKYTVGYNIDNVWLGKDFLFSNDPNTWTHIAFVWQGNGVIDFSNFSLYINGQLQSGTTNHYYNPLLKPIPSSPLSMLETLILGNLGGISYKGILDDVIVYERALTPVQIDSVYKDDPNCNNPIAFTQQPVNKIICQGNNASFSIAATYAATYQWQEFKNNSWTDISAGSNYSGTTSNTLTVINPPSTFNNYQYRCVVKNICNGSATSAAAVLTVDTIMTDLLGINITTSTTKICQGSPVTFTANVINGGNNHTYQWKVNTTITAGANGQTFTTSTLNSGDNVSCVVTRQNACMAPVSVISNALSILVNPKLTPFITITANPNEPVGPYTPITFSTNPTAAGNAPTFQWMRNGVDIPNATNATYTTAMLSDNDVIGVKMISNDTCTTKQDAVSNALTIHINTSIGATKSNNIDVYPNPVRDMLTVRTKCTNCCLSIIDITGKTLQKIDLRNGLNTIDMKSLQPGLYMLRYTDGTNHETIRITKQ